MKVAFLCMLFPDQSVCDMRRIDWVVVNFSPERVALLERQIELANEIREKDPMLREMQFKMNEVEVYDYFLTDLDGKDRMNAFDEACDRGWVVLPDDLDLSPYEPLDLKRLRFCVRPAKGTRPATFNWLIHIKGETGPVRSVKWRLADLEEVLSKAGIAA